MANSKLSFQAPGDKTFRATIQRLNATKKTKVTITASDKETATEKINRRERFLAKVLTVRECLPKKDSIAGLFLSK